MMKPLFVTLALMVTVFAAKAQTTIPLYENKIPNYIATSEEEQKNDWGFVTKITKPTLTVYLPEAGKANGTAVVIFPGGGYSGVAIEHEGKQVAEEFKKKGVAAFVVKYRMPNDKAMPDKSIGPLQDAQQAIKVVRERAKEWNIDLGKVGILGFSAGGHLASTAGTYFNTAVIENKKGINLRPDFMALIYPVISFSDSLTHMGSRDNLLGKKPSVEKVKSYSNEKMVSPQTPLTFLVHAGDDDVVKVENSLVFYEALHKHRVPAKLLVYPKGGHGFGLNNPTTSDRWIEHCFTWMQSNGWLGDSK